MTFPKFKDNEDWYVFLYTADNFTGDLIDCNEGILKWVDKEKVLEMPTWAGDLIFLKWILEKRNFFSAKFVYENGKLVDHIENFY